MMFMLHSRVKFTLKKCERADLPSLVEIQLQDAGVGGHEETR